MALLVNKYTGNVWPKGEVLEPGMQARALLRFKEVLQVLQHKATALRILRQGHVIEENRHVGLDVDFSNCPRCPP